MNNKISIFWFRRDLRLEDNTGLFHALKSGNAVLPIFIFDTEILNNLENKNDRRVDFIHQVLIQLQLKINKLGSNLSVFNGKPLEIFKDLVQKYSIQSVFTNHDYEPLAIKRDEEIATFLKTQKIDFKSFKDQVIFEKNEITKDDGLPYTIFTPFSKKWKSKLNSFYLKPYPTEKYYSNFIQIQPEPIISLQNIGFKKTEIEFKEPLLNEKIISQYHENRDFPALNATTKLSIHLRFGTVSIRKLAAYANLTNETWLNELIWREFYMMILFHFPHVVGSSFKKQYDSIVWRNNEAEFELWKSGKTGYPIVDAGMIELNETGFMHNRVRMIVASFLTKHLLIDWRWGENYFAEKLNDFELASNNGGWQWSAGSGCDAAPYFRVFNPSEQTKKFDSKMTYIRKWIPEIDTFKYPQPMVDHKFARERVLKVYKEALDK